MPVNQYYKKDNFSEKGLILTPSSQSIIVGKSRQQETGGHMVRTLILHWALSAWYTLNVLRKVHIEGLVTNSDYSCAMWCDHNQSFNAPGPIILSIKRALIYLLQGIWKMKLCICNVTRNICFSVNIVFCYWPPTHVPLSGTGASVWLWGDSHDHVNCGQANLHFTSRNYFCYLNSCWESF